jgi:YgiT-type zinc finger domain-containing protein
MTRLKLSTCPTCGNKNLKKVRKAVTGTRQGKRYSAPNVEFYECHDCGEKIYDSSAIEQIEQHSHVRTKRRPARKTA